MQMKIPHAMHRLQEWQAAEYLSEVLHYRAYKLQRRMLRLQAEERKYRHRALYARGDVSLFSTKEHYQ